LANSTSTQVEFLTTSSVVLICEVHECDRWRTMLRRNVQQ